MSNEDHAQQIDVLSAPPASDRNYKRIEKLECLVDALQETTKATARNYNRIEELKKRMDALSEVLITDHDSLTGLVRSVGAEHERLVEMRILIGEIEDRLEKGATLPAVLSNDGPAAVDAYQRGFHDALQLQRDGKILVVIDADQGVI